jgi:hypothetical protein
MTPPLYDYACPNDECPRHDQADTYLVRSADDEIRCPTCDALLMRRFPLIGGYTAIPNNGASERPKSAGSRPKGAK